MAPGATVTPPVRLPFTTSRPAFTVVPPPTALAPVSISVPLPCLTSPPAPPIEPANVVSAVLFAVSVPPPSAMAPPEPDSAPTVWLLPSRSKVPPFTVSAPPGNSDAPGPSRRVPASTVVPPE